MTYGDGLVVGIDPGVNTGLAIWSRSRKGLIECKSCGIVEDVGHQVYVALYDLTPADERALDDWEGVGSGLRAKIRVRVSTLEGDVTAWAYVLNAYEGGLPSARYLGMLADSAEAGGAPDDYVAELRSRPCTSNEGPLPND